MWYLNYISIKLFFQKVLFSHFFPEYILNSYSVQVTRVIVKYIRFTEDLCPSQGILLETFPKLPNKWLPLGLSHCTTIVGVIHFGIFVNVSPRMGETTTKALACGFFPGTPPFFPNTTKNQFFFFFTRIIEYVSKDWEMDSGWSARLYGFPQQALPALMRIYREKFHNQPYCPDPISLKIFIKEVPIHHVVIVNLIYRQIIFSRIVQTSFSKYANCHPLFALASLNCQLNM